VDWRVWFQPNVSSRFGKSHKNRSLKIKIIFAILVVISLSIDVLYFLRKLSVNWFIASFLLWLIAAAIGYLLKMEEGA
jgi:hypothetical protein